MFPLPLPLPLLLLVERRLPVMIVDRHVLNLKRNNRHIAEAEAIKMSVSFARARCEKQKPIPTRVGMGFCLHYLFLLTFCISVGKLLSRNDDCIGECQMQKKNIFVQFLNNIIAWWIWQREYTFFLFLGDIIALWRRKLSEEGDSVAYLQDRKRGVLSPKKFEILSQSIGKERSWQFLFIYLAWLSGVSIVPLVLFLDSVLCAMFCVLYAILAFSIAKAHRKRMYDLVEN